MDLADELGGAVSDLSDGLGHFMRRVVRRLRRMRQNLRPTQQPPARKRPAPAKRVQQRENLAATGPVVLIGGNQLSDDVVVQLLHLAGGRSARVVVLPTASLDFSKAGERYVRAFTRFGMDNVASLDLVTRERATSQEWLEPLASADIILLGGGETARILAVLGGTPASDALIAALARGAVVAALSGGACALGQWAVGPLDQYGLATARPGLGLLPNLLVYQCGLVGSHVSQCYVALAQTGDENALALGLDEGTAAVVQPNLHVSVSGEGCLLVVEPTADPSAGEPMCNMPTHVVPSGRTFDLATCRLLPRADGRQQYRHTGS